MALRPTRREVLAFSSIAIAGVFAGCSGDSSPSMTDTSPDPTTESTSPPPTSTTPTDEPTTRSTPASTTGSTPTTTEAQPTASETPTSTETTTIGTRTTYPSGDGRLTVEGVEATGSTSGELTVNPPNTVSLVEFFATWCSPCKDQMSTLRALRADYSRETVSFISITQENKPDAVKNFWKEYEGTWRVGIDEGGTVTQKYGIRGYPTAIILLPDGTKVAEHVGSRRKSKYVDDLDAALSKLND